MPFHSSDNSVLLRIEELLSQILANQLAEAAERRMREMMYGSGPIRPNITGAPDSG